MDFIRVLLYLKFELLVIWIIKLLEIDFYPSKKRSIFERLDVSQKWSVNQLKRSMTPYEWKQMED